MVLTVKRTTKGSSASTSKSRSSANSIRTQTYKQSHKKSRSSSKFFDSNLAEKIDKLFACGVGNNDVNLPQLVVVGQQSRRKSSVLEGLTNHPFSRDSGLHTRFATQSTFRKEAVARVQAFITPTMNRSTERQKRVKSWSKEMDEFDEEVFLEVMEEVSATSVKANEVLGVGPHANGHHSAFSDDILNLEHHWSGRRPFQRHQRHWSFKANRDGCNDQGRHHNGGTDGPWVHEEPSIHHARRRSLQCRYRKPRYHREGGRCRSKRSTYAWYPDQTRSYRPGSRIVCRRRIRIGNVPSAPHWRQDAASSTKVEDHSRRIRQRYHWYRPPLYQFGPQEPHCR